MPTYRFECNECKTEFEFYMSVKEYTNAIENNKIKCPNCGSTNLSRIFKPLAVIYKTTGFYTTTKRLNEIDPGLGDASE